MQAQRVGSLVWLQRSTSANMPLQCGWVQVVFGLRRRGRESKLTAGSSPWPEWLQADYCRITSWSLLSAPAAQVLREGHVLQVGVWAAAGFPQKGLGADSPGAVTLMRSRSRRSASRSCFRTSPGALRLGTAGGHTNAHTLPLHPSHPCAPCCVACCVLWYTAVAPRLRR